MLVIHSMKCYVTGGTGFLEKKLIHQLISKGHSVRALVRKSDKTDDLLFNGVELIYGDITDENIIRKSVQGMDWVFHCWRLSKIWAGNRRDLYQSNVDGMSNLVDQASLANCKKIIYTGSFIALGPTDGNIADEKYKSIRNKFYNDYQESKYIAHRNALRYCGAGLPFIPLYPGVIYGPGESSEENIIVRLILDILKNKIPSVPSSGEQIWNYVYIDDVVQGHILAAEKGRNGQPYIIGGENKSFNDIIKIISEIIEYPVPHRNIPIWQLKSTGLLEEIMAKLLHRYPRITRSSLELLRHDWALSSDKAINELGYKYRTLKEGLKITYDWLKNKNSEK